MKTISKNYWKYLFWLGPFLVIMGMVAGLVSAQWGAIPIGLMIGGIVATLLWLLFQAQRNSWWSRRSTQAGTNALIATLAVLVILGLVNFLAVRYPVRVDLTETGLYTLAPQSRQLVRSLQKPVKLWIFDRNQNPEDRLLLENYRRQGQNFSFAYVDPQVNLGLANKFNVQRPGEVHLESGQQRRLLQTVNEQERLSETRLTNALQQITSNFKAKVYFLQGHGEYPVAGESPLAQALGVLADRNYTLEPLNLAQQPKVPQDATVVVIAGARRSLLAPEVKALSAYLNQGGSLLLAIDPTINLGIDSLLKTWGVTLDNRLVVNPAGTALGYGPAEILVDNYGQHPITQDFSNGITILQAVRPIEITPVNGVQATPLLITSPQSWAESDLKSENLQFDPKSDRNGPLTVGIALTKPSSNARLVVVGSSNFITNEQFQQQLNGDLFTNSISWLSKQDAPAQLSIRPKEAKNRRINLQAAQANVLGLAALGLVPLIGFAAAAILWWQRR
ncbi:GldG family protein [Aliterella atlantica]|uniref:ABC transporter n=1 Tax=Aliterella atlantica CENA595 TaxID=1618023 RepID=A0A0D8ZUH9_9CYAN|nr:Gldg family protein [Aliterella atlantica]KJH72428.1 ABC transporter [Aliterella atlantica CENA595]